jgi:choline kinase
MPRFITNIKKKNLENDQITVAFLSAGYGSKIKSYEPRSLLKIKGSTLIESQVNIVSNYFNNPEIIYVVGCYANKVIKKFGKRVRIVENQLHENTNSSESLRLAFNNTVNNKFMFIHGDILFNESMLNVSYDKSFIITDSTGMMKDEEIGVTKNKNKLSILSYGLPLKWAQVAFFTGKEYNIVKSIFNKFEDIDKKKLSFEIINQVVDSGGNFECYEPKQMELLEIDRIKDVK